MSSPLTSSTRPNRSRNSARMIAQTSVDAKLDAEFSEMGSSFDYSHTVEAMQKVHKVSRENLSSTSGPRSERVMAYLQHIQKGKLIQPFGCLLAVDEKSFKVVAYSENAREMLTVGNHQVPGADDSPSLGMGTDVRTLFTSSSTGALQKALGFAEVYLLNPILVHCKTSGNPFYAIVHRVPRCMIIDFEPVNLSEVPTTAAGAFQSYKLAAKAIAKLQSLPGGSMERLCNTVVQEVFELTGYDRVMAYKFHEDDHGEVIAEITKPGLEPYIGLHYPATDIPQAARFLFMKTKVRMICDCRVKPAKVYQDEKLPFEIISCGSTLRAPHSCHLMYMKNMNSIASLVMAVVVNEGEEDDQRTDRGQPQQKTRLWGLVVCHHQSPRFIPFPLRYACQFLMQVFAVHVNGEFELENQIREKNILRTQTLLCDVLLRYADPISIITRSPNIMDLVKCDGAALLYQNRIWRLGFTPTDSEIRDIAIWLSECHMDSSDFCTDSLYDAGYPAALAPGDTVCGMAAARVTSEDFLFWFRSHTAAEVRWGGAKHDPSDEDDAKQMQPRSSFRAFLDVMKMKSLPWHDCEMDAIHSLQLILRHSFNERNDISNNASLDSRSSNLKLEGTVELQALRNEMVRLVETARVPILAVDVDCLVNGWNMKIAELTGLSIRQALGRHLLTLVEDCSADIVKKMVYFALQGKEEKGVQFQMKTHGPRGDDVPVMLLVNACANRDHHKNVVGACFIAQDMTSHKTMMDKFTRMEGDYKAIVQNPNPLIPPIFGADEFGWCSEWNPAMSKLSGWERDEVIDKMLLGEVFGTNVACCRLKTLDTFVKFSIIINNAMMGQDTEKASFTFVNRNGKHVDCLFSVYKKVDGEGVVTGVYCFLHVTSQELHQVLHTQQQSEQTKRMRLKALTYIRHAIRSPLSGITHSRKMLEGTNLSEEQKQLVSTLEKCQLRLNRILNDLDLENIMDSCMHLEMVEFVLHDVVITAISQVMIASERKGVGIINNINEEFTTEVIYGDSVRLQQIVANYLLMSVKFSPTGGQVEITASLIKDRLRETLHLIHLELRISHVGREVPAELLSEMFGNDKDPSAERLSLLVCRKLLMIMNGGVRYLSEAGKSTFIIMVELASASNLGGSRHPCKGQSLNA